jgi:hypothetical protein
VDIGDVGDITIVRPAAAAPPRRPEQVEMRRARVFGDLHVSAAEFLAIVVDDPVARAAFIACFRSPLNDRSRPSNSNALVSVVTRAEYGCA